MEEECSGLVRGTPEWPSPETLAVTWSLLPPPLRKWGGLQAPNEMGLHPPPDLQPTVRLFRPSSPFKIKVLPAHDASKVRASGPGLNASGIPASLPVEFTIDARDAGEGLLTVQILVSPRTAQVPQVRGGAQAGLDLRFSPRILRVSPRRPTSETTGMAPTPCPTCQT